MKILYKTGTVMGLTLLLITSNLFAQSAEQVLQRVQKKLDSYRTVCAQFKQTFRWELADQTQIIEGNICVKNGKQFRIETDDQEIISDGKTIWIVNKLNNQIIVKSAETGSEEHPFLRNFVQKYIDDYKAEREQAEKEIILKLTSKTAGEFYPHIQLFIAGDYTIQKIIQTDINENHSTYEVLSLQAAPALSDKTFAQPAFQGYEIIDLR